MKRTKHGYGAKSYPKSVLNTLKVKLNLYTIVDIVQGKIFQNISC